MTPDAAVPLFADAPVPDGIVEAFWGYDAALLTNDVTALDNYFEKGDTTLRGDGQEIITGWANISQTPAARTTIPTRAVTALHLRILTDDVVFTTAEVRSANGAKGQQTQLWRRNDDVWRIMAAHVTAPAKTLDTTVWRVVGSPLLAATGSGALDRSTVAVKDLFAVAGFAIGGGVKRFLAQAADEPAHAPAVAALLDAGASITGIAQTDELAFSLAGTNIHYGTPVNPAAPGRITGGSSSGPAAAVARGWADLGLATDTAGSIRVPASYKGFGASVPATASSPRRAFCPLHRASTRSGGSRVMRPPSRGSGMRLFRTVARPAPTHPSSSRPSC